MGNWTTPMCSIFGTLRGNVVDSTDNGQSSLHIARPCTPRAHQKLAYAWSARACNLQAAATTNNRFDRIIAQ
eukprot:4896570-Lingulodinium_polyedra.AAC.1